MIIRCRGHCDLGFDMLRHGSISSVHCVKLFLGRELWFWILSKMKKYKYLEGVVGEEGNSHLILLEDYTLITPVFQKALDQSDCSILCNLSKESSGEVEICIMISGNQQHV